MIQINFVLVLVFAAACGWVIISSSRQRSGMIQYPFLAATVMAGWFFPQLIGLTLDNGIPPASTTKLIVFSTLCLVLGYAGYRSYRPRDHANETQYVFSRFMVASLVFCALGAYFYFQVQGLAAEASAIYGDQWSGPITIYVFLSTMLNIGMAMALVMQIHRPNWTCVWIVAFCSILTLYKVLILGRREEAVTYFLMIMAYCWFRYRWLPPRTVIFAFIAAGTLFVANVGQYRTTMLDKGANYGWSGKGPDELANIDYVSNFLNVQSSDQHVEAGNAALIIEATDRYKEFDFGSSLWNNFVHRYVPGQIIGNDRKEALLIPLDDLAYREFFHVSLIGATLTGFADAFSSFWYFGCLIFFLIGRVMAYWFSEAQRGSPSAQLVVMLITAKSLLAITHETHAFFLEFVLLGAFLGPTLRYARKRGSTTPSAGYAGRGMPGSLASP